MRRSSQRTQDLIAEANERADVAEQRADKADLQMATMAAAAADLAAALRCVQHGSHSTSDGKR